MNNKNKHINKVYYITSHLIFLSILAYGLLYLKPGDEIGFVITSLYLIMPVTSLITGIVMGTKNLRFKWLNSAALGLLGAVIPIIIFPKSFSIIVVAFSLVPVIIGTIVGGVFHNSK